MDIISLFKVICGQFFVLFLEGMSHGTRVVLQSKIKMTLNHDYDHQFGSGLYASAFGFVIFPALNTS